MRNLLTPLLLLCQLVGSLGWENYEQPGVCPDRHFVLPGNNYGCSVDGHCRDQKKCCFDSRNQQVCVVPMPACDDGRRPTYICPLHNRGSCPNDQTLVRRLNWSVCCHRQTNIVCPSGQQVARDRGGHHYRCDWDSTRGCPSNTRCTRVRGEMVCCPSSGVVRSKPGNCPNPARINNLWRDTCADECAMDSDCSGQQKCCRNTCNAAVCTANVNHGPEDPHIRPRPGHCPAQNSLVQSCDTNAARCGSDAQCKDNYKCCPNVIGVPVCQPVDAGSGGSADVCSADNVPGGALCTLTKKCKGDAECDGDDRCCSMPFCKNKHCTPNGKSSNLQEKNCPAKSLMGDDYVHQCNTDEDCHTGLICCENKLSKGRCVHPTSAHNRLAAIRLRLVDEYSECPEPTYHVRRNEWTCFTDRQCNDANQKCCPGPRHAMYCVPVTARVRHENELVAREFSLYESQCRTIVDRDLPLTVGEAITFFHIVMYSAQDVAQDKAYTTFPTLRIQLWRATNKPEGDTKARFRLICEQLEERITSKQGKVSYKFTISQPCFNNPGAGDRVGFTFDYMKAYDYGLTVNPVPYDHDNDMADGHGTDWREFQCNGGYVPRVNDDVTFTSTSTAYPGRWSYGVSQGGPPRPLVP